MPDQPEPTPVVLGGVGLTDNTLTLSYKGKKHYFARDGDGQVNLIELDMWLTDMFKAEWEAEMRRMQLSGRMP